MDSETEKPVWLQIYFGISLILFIFGVIVTITDRSGYGAIVTIPLIIISVILFGISYGVYYWKKRNKKLIGNLILWPLFLIPVGFTLWQIVQTTIWYSTVGLQGWPIFIFTIIMSVLLLILLIILNKNEK